MIEMNYQNSLTKPSVFLRWMVLFLMTAGFLGMLLYTQIFRAFMANPGLNGLIAGVLLLGTLYSFRQIIRLYPEINWVNHFRLSDITKSQKRPPVLLSPMVKLMSDRPGTAVMSTEGMRSILESIGSRLDEARDTSRYLIGLLIFLGLLGTFWGLLETINSVGKTIGALPTGGDNLGGLEDLISGLKAPLSGMGTAFSSSLFGLAGSLILGFLDLQASHAHNRFYNELEDWLASITTLGDSNRPGIDANQVGYAVQELQRSIALLTQNLQQGGGAMNLPGGDNGGVRELASGIDGLVKQMRAEQQVVREWMDEQASQQADMSSTLKAISGKSGLKRR